MKRMLPRFASLMLLAILPASCVIIPRSPTLPDFLPRDTDVPGWVPARQEHLNSKRKIQRKAPLFAEYDAAEAVIAVYNRLSNSERVVRLDIARFASPLDSFGVFSRARDSEGPGRFIDDNTFTAASVIVFRIGRYYARIAGLNPSGEGENDLDQFKSVLRQNLEPRAGRDKLPKTMFFLSPGGSSREISYFKNGLPQLPGMKRVYTVRRTIDGKSRDIFFRRSGSAYDAEVEFQNVVRASDGAFMLTRIGGIQPAIRIIGEREHVFLAGYRQWLFGFLNAESIAEGNRNIVLLYGEVRRREDSGRKKTGR